MEEETNSHVVMLGEEYTDVAEDVKKYKITRAGIAVLEDKRFKV